MSTNKITEQLKIFLIKINNFLWCTIVTLIPSQPLAFDGIKWL